MVRVQTSMEVQKALGRYRGPWPSLLSITIVAMVFLGTPVIDLIGHHFGTGDLVRLLIWSALLSVVGIVPQSIVSVRGIRLVWRFRFIPWADVARLYWSGPRERELMIGLADGTRLTVSGLPRDRLPGVLILARQAAPSSPTHSSDPPPT